MQQVSGAAPLGVCSGLPLIIRRHVDYCRTCSAVCPSVLPCGFSCDVLYDVLRAGR